MNNDPSWLAMTQAVIRSTLDICNSEPSALKSAFLFWLNNPQYNYIEPANQIIKAEYPQFLKLWQQTQLLI